MEAFRADPPSIKTAGSSVGPHTVLIHRRPQGPGGAPGTWDLERAAPLLPFRGATSALNNAAFLKEKREIPV